MCARMKKRGNAKAFINMMAGAAFVLSGMNICHAAETTRAREAHACEKDAFKFCGNDIPNKKKIAACLQANREQLRPACRAMFPASDAPVENMALGAPRAPDWQAGQ
ncbi:hypothetical protein [Komagataeibacter xylinus]|uniref:hypothetical protein n=2 Tax=Komagataeibacter xylinus TaxID=28448 RepID=UPI000AB76A68|nr:hypothetical protein [Komagataeibacter xylinus]GBQ75840.1 hypothetical protein AA15237_2157 [Komagataeibacter xylinus NBRC 15237]